MSGCKIYVRVQDICGHVYVPAPARCQCAHLLSNLSPCASAAMSVGQLGSRATLTMGAAWKVMGARGRQAGLLDRVALFRMVVSNPLRAKTLPAGTLERRSSDLQEGHACTQVQHTSNCLPNQEICCIR